MGDNEKISSINPIKKNKNDEIKVIKTRLLLNKKLLFRNLKRIIKNKMQLLSQSHQLLKFLLGCFLIEGLSKMLNLSPTFSAIGILK